MTRVLHAHMLQNSTTKRKVPDDDTNTAKGNVTMNNPLVNAAKKAKRESKAGASNKRKLVNAEEQPGGLLIVRAPSVPPSSMPGFPTTTLTTKPPSKKFKSSQPSHSQLLPSTSKSSSRVSFLPSSQPIMRHDTPDPDPTLEHDVQIMDDEVAHLQRTSRGPSHILPGPGQRLNSQFQFPAKQAIGMSTGKALGAETAKGKTRRKEIITDISAPLPAESDETPQIQRNKQYREAAMAMLQSGKDLGNPITPTRGRSMDGDSSGSGHRRKSSVSGRGKRFSTSFETTGVITQPHNTVSDASFYKHIDVDLPDAERVRQLLIWCSARAASSLPSTSSFNTPDPPPPPLPPLSATAQQALKSIQDDIIQKLAEKRVDLGAFGGLEAQEDDGKKKENAQNVTNRVWEEVYGGQIKSAVEEEESWKKIGYFYDTYARRIRTKLEKRKTALDALSSSPSTSGPITGANTLSAKAKGKQRANNLEPRENELPAPFQAGMRLARSVIARARRRTTTLLPTTSTATPGAGPSTTKGADPDSRPLLSATQMSYDIDMGGDAYVLGEAEEATREREVETAVRSRMGDVEFKLDHLYVLASQARATTEAAQLALDQRFEIIAQALDARSKPPPVGEGDILGRYVRGGSRPEANADEALQLLRALARVDAARPPAQVGDAARRAVREVQRVGENGGLGVVGERRLTGLPPGGVGVTPRKMPGTPRRGTTPSRERER